MPAFVHLIVMVRLGSHLGKVGDAENLRIVTQFPQMFADDFSRGPADTGIDFIEDQGRNSQVVRGGDLYGKTEP